MSGEYVNRPGYAAVHAMFPGVKLDGGGMSPMQGRVVFHQERIFRSTGTGLRAHDRYLQLTTDACLSELISEMGDDECVFALELIEQAARDCRLHLFRDVNTGWRELKFPEVYSKAA